MRDSVSGLQATKSKITKQVLSRIDKLPSLSNVIGEFLELTKKEYISARDFERVICKDQALVSRMLKLANSSLYGKSKKINSITEAVVMIGMDNVKKIVYAVSSEGLIRRDFKNYLYPNKGFWLHSMGVAIASRVLNEKTKSPVLGDEMAFVAGLIHDSGKLIIDEFLDTSLGPHLVTLREEVEAVGIDHSQLGNRIMKAWNIPDKITEAVKYHHNPRSLNEVKVSALLVSLADSICNLWNVGTQPFMDLGEEIDLGPFGEDLAELDIPKGAMEGVLWEIRQKLANLEDLYNIDE